MTTELFKTVQGQARSLNETNDCAVKAVAIATGTPYEQVHALMKKHGRKDRKGTMQITTQHVLEALGYTVDKVHMPCDVRAAARQGGTFRNEFVAQRLAKYPYRRRVNVKNFTVNHLEIFKEAWADVGTVLVNTKGHILAYRDGQVHDWTRNHRNRILTVWLLKKN